MQTNTPMKPSNLDQFESPKSIGEEYSKTAEYNLAEESTLGDKILFFEKKARNNQISENLEDNNFASNEIDSFSAENEIRDEINDEMKETPIIIPISFCDSNKNDNNNNLSTKNNVNNNLSNDNIISNSNDLNSRESPKGLKEIIKKWEELAPITQNKNKSKNIPLSSQIIQDFTKFPNRPSFLNSSSSIKTKSCINSTSLYRKKNILFSNSDVHSIPFVFRSPGNILSTKPILLLCNSILTELGTRYYIKVQGKSMGNGIVWYILKKLEEPEFELGLISKNDSSLSNFILSDVVTEVYKRTNYLIYKEEKLLGKIIGNSLCICRNDKCIKAIGIEEIEKKGRNSILFGNKEIISFSCEVERDEWIEVLERKSNK